VGPATLGEGHPSPAQDRERRRVAAALGRPVAAEPEHVRPRSQPQPVQLRAAAQLPAGPDELGHMGRELVEALQVVGVS
jgi:hypothetical protein